MAPPTCSSWRLEAGFLEHPAVHSLLSKAEPPSAFLSILSSVHAPELGACASGEARGAAQGSSEQGSCSCLLPKLPAASSDSPSQVVFQDPLVLDSEGPSFCLWLSRTTFHRIRVDRLSLGKKVSPQTQLIG